MCFWWGNFHILDRKWFIGFPQYCCLAFNNLQKEQRKREWHLHWEGRHTETDSYISTCKIPARILGRGKTREKKTNEQKTQPTPNYLYIHVSPCFFYHQDHAWLCSYLCSHIQSRSFFVVSAHPTALKDSRTWNKVIHVSLVANSDSFKFRGCKVESSWQYKKFSACLSILHDWGLLCSVTPLYRTILVRNDSNLLISKLLK